MPQQPAETIQLFISTQDKKCRSAFDSLSEASSLTSKVEEQYDRYKVWSLNVGAGHSGLSYKKSLDYRLREAPRHRDQILDILRSLYQLIDDAKAYATGSPENDLLEQSDNGSDEDGNSELAGKWTLSDSDDNDDVDGDGNDRKKESDSARSRLTNHRDNAATGLEWFSSNSKLQATLASIELAVTSLYRIPVRQPATYSRLKRYEKSDNRDFVVYSHFDCLYIKDAFPNADSRVVSRLGKLITERRRITRYRQLYNDELQRETADSRNVVQTPQPVEPLVKPSANVILLHTDALTETHPSTAPKSSLDPTTFRPNEDAIIRMPELLPMFPEVDEATSIATTSVEKEIIMIPPRPRTSEHKEMQDFICPYCGIAIHVYSSRAWRKHIYADLKPYVCTYANCTEPDHMFEDRDDWFAHECRHRYTYSCGFEGHESNNDITSLCEHMESEHNIKLPRNDDTSQFEVFQRQIRQREGRCNLCGHPTSNLKQHLGRHLERIALFSIPRRDFVSDADADRFESSDISVGNTQGSLRKGDKLNSAHFESASNESLQDDDDERKISEAGDIRYPDEETEISFSLPDEGDIPDAPEGGDWYAIKPQLRSSSSHLESSSKEQGSGFDNPHFADVAPKVHTDRHILVMGLSGPAKHDYLRFCMDENIDFTPWAATEGRKIKEHVYQTDSMLVHLYDVPGFDRVDNYVKVLIDFVSLLSHLQERGQSLDAMLYLHQQESSAPNLEADMVFIEKIVSGSLLTQVYLVETPTRRQQNLHKSLEHEMKLAERWGPFLKNGSQWMYHDGTREAAIDHILTVLGRGSKLPVGQFQVYHELDQQGCTLSMTTAGAHLLGMIQHEHSRLASEYQLAQNKPRKSHSGTASGPLGALEIESQWTEARISALALRQFKLQDAGADLSNLGARFQALAIDEVETTFSDTISGSIANDETDFMPFGCIHFPPRTRSYGLEAALGTLDVIFQPATASNIGKVSVLIWGLIGVGKSHLAREYVWRERAHYPGGIFWIDCSTVRASLECFERIMVKIGLAPGQDTFLSIFPRFRSWIRNQERWLMVFDGIDQPDIEASIGHLCPMVPDDGRGNLIFLSRSRDLGRFSNLAISTALQVHSLSKDEGMSMILDRMDPQQGTGILANKALEIYQFSGGIPLVLRSITEDMLSRGILLEQYKVDEDLPMELIRLLEKACRVLSHVRSSSARLLALALAFWGHIIPVEMIELGSQAADYDDPLPSALGLLKQEDLEISLESLVRCGLVEATEAYLSRPPDALHRDMPVDEEAKQEQILVPVIKIAPAFQGALRHVAAETPFEYHQAWSTLLRMRSAWLLFSIRIFCHSFRQASSGRGIPSTDEDDNDVVRLFQYKSHADMLLEHHRDNFAADEEEIIWRPSCQRCQAIKTTCDRGRPCGRCKGLGIDNYGCVSGDRDDENPNEFSDLISELYRCSDMIAAALGPGTQNRSSRYAQSGKNERFSLYPRSNSNHASFLQEAEPTYQPMMSRVQNRKRTDTESAKQPSTERTRRSYLPTSSSSRPQYAVSSTGIHLVGSPSSRNVMESLSETLLQPWSGDENVSIRARRGSVSPTDRDLGQEYLFNNSQGQIITSDAEQYATEQARPTAITGQTIRSRSRSQSRVRPGASGQRDKSQPRETYQANADGYPLDIARVPDVQPPESRFTRTRRFSQPARTPVQQSDFDEAFDFGDPDSDAMKMLQLPQ